MRRSRIAARLPELALLTVVYVVAGKLGLRLAFVHASATAVWPPTGIALATLVLRGLGLWPAVLLGAFLVNVTTAGSVATSLGIAAVVSLTVVAVGAVVAERRRLEARLLRLADHDPLTDLFSRRRLQEELHLTLAQARRYGTRGALLFLDLDDFKSVNDVLGHHAADRVLAALARRLRGRLRHSDVVARMGGDEFAVLLPHTDRVQGQALAAQLLEAIRAHPIEGGGPRVAISAAIGMALYPEHGTTTEELLAHADQAMYQAKGMGGNRCQVYSPDERWQKAVEASFRSEGALRAALDEGRFLFHGQPILDLRHNRVPHYELLLRMVGEDGELLPPGAFLGQAERCGLLAPIERWVVRQGILLLARDGHGKDDYALSINLSGRAFSDPELPSLIEGELATTGIAPARLVLEFSEGAAVAELDQAREFALAVRRLGCRLALDDFGVGMSSLHHLAQLPVDYLKIDGSFVHDVARSPVERQLVRAVVEMALALGRQTIAESVTDEPTLQVLRACGVDYAQGYHVGRPCALAELWPGRPEDRKA